MRRAAGELDLSKDVLASTKTGIQQISLLQRFCHCHVFGEMLGLASDGRFPFDPEPPKILQQSGFVLSFATSEINVLYPEQEPAVGSLSRFVCE